MNNFENLPSQNTPLSAERLNEMLNLINEKATIQTGDWTPSIINFGTGGNPTVTYTYANGKYIKIGKLVAVFFNMRGVISEVKGDNYSAIGGLPFNVSGRYGTGSLQSAYNATQQTNGMPSIYPTSNYLRLQETHTSYGGGVARYKVTPSSSYFELAGGAVYYTEN